MNGDNRELSRVTCIILDACIKVHRHVGPGCFERVYEELLNHELINRNLVVERQVFLPITFGNLFIEDAYKLDLLINEQVIVEIKSVEKLAPAHFKQVMTYLKLSNLKNGVLLNFNVDLMRDGFHRVFNNI